MANQLTNINGVWTLQTMASASSGGSTSQVQFNDSGSFGGDSGLTFDSGTSTLTGATVKASALTGSLTKLSNGSDYLVAGTSITLATGSSGQVTVTSSGYSGVSDVVKASTIHTEEVLQSTSYTDLATVGPTVTMTTGTSVVCHIYSTAYGEVNDIAAMISVAVSGATTVAAADAIGANGGGSTYVHLRTAYNYYSHIASFLFTGLTPGSNTFTMKYRGFVTSRHWYGRRGLVVQRID